MTRKAEQALLIIYCQYKKRLGCGTKMSDASYFENSKLIKIDGFSDWNHNDLWLSIQQLKTKGYVKINICDDVTITSDGIEYVESKPKEYFAAFSGAISELMAIVSSFISI